MNPSPITTGVSGKKTADSHQRQVPPQSQLSAHPTIISDSRLPKV